MKKEHDFSKARVHKGSLLNPKGPKIQKTFRLDENVRHWLVEEGRKTGPALSNPHELHPEEVHVGKLYFGREGSQDRAKASP